MAIGVIRSHGADRMGGINYDSWLQNSDGFPAANVRQLSSQSLYLLASVLAQAFFFNVPDSARDDLDALIAKTHDELMTPYEVAGMSAFAHYRWQALSSANDTVQPANVDVDLLFNKSVFDTSDSTLFGVSPYLYHHRIQRNCNVVAQLGFTVSRTGMRMLIKCERFNFGAWDLVEEVGIVSSDYGMNFVSFSFDNVGMNDYRFRIRANNSYRRYLSAHPDRVGFATTCATLDLVAYE